MLLNHILSVTKVNAVQLVGNGTDSVSGHGPQS